MNSGPQDISVPLNLDKAEVEHYTIRGEKIPPLFAPENRIFWAEIRRILIWLLRLLKKFYNFPEITI
jgi:hypothetical protein